ncbi:14263_t:CDS:2 [Cetraspora pellucida]|uniref:14263_t:CDS:1 n=1 Tax=Cetraspora pellucida TaxID=1433469 RepID=A0A9N9N9H6_9GLOM|nr:14263_t:CDS:2 [Cetraspora pellucida]
MIYWLTHLKHGHRELTYNPLSEISINMVQTIKYSLIRMFLRTSKTITLELLNTLVGSEVKLIIEAVYKNFALKRLILCNNQLCPEIGKAFAKALYNNDTLTQLSFSGNELTFEVVKALTDVLLVNTTLNHLCLNNNGIDSEGGKALMKAISKNTTLTLLYLKGNDFDYEVHDKLKVTLFTKNISTDLPYLDSYDFPRCSIS